MASKSPASPTRMPRRRSDGDNLNRQIASLRGKLAEAQDTIRAIRRGEIDAIVTSGRGGRVYTLEGAEHPYRVFVESLKDGAATLTTDGFVAYGNSALSRMIGAGRRPVVGSPLADYVRKSSMPAFDALRERALARGSAAGELEMKRGRATFPAYFSATALKTGGGASLCVIITDLTEQKRSEKVLASARLTSGIIEQVGEALVVCDRDGVVLRASALARELAGRNPLGKHVARMLPLRSAQGKAMFSWGPILAGTALRDFDVWLTAGGRRYDLVLNARPLVDSSGETIGSIITLSDQTERRLAEEAFKAATNRFLLIFRESPVGLYIMRASDTRFVDVNDAFLHITGYDRADLVGKTSLELGIWPHPEAWRKIVRSLARRRQVQNLEVQLHRKSGELIDVLGSIIRFDFDGEPCHLGSIIEISERKAAERELHQMNRTLRALSQSNQARVRATDEQGYLNEVCRIIVEDCGHAMAWIALAENDEAKTARAAAHAGVEDGYLQTVRITWGDDPLGQGPTGTAIRSGKPNCCLNTLTDPRFEPWREEALKRGYASSIALPLLDGAEAFGALTIYSRQSDPFSDDEIKLLEELARDVSYGLISLKLRAIREGAEEVLRRDKEELEQIVQERTRELLRTHEELERSKRLSDIGTLAATIAHELRNPLAAISMAAANIQRKAKNPVLEKHIHNIESKITESGQIINNLLFYSRLRPPRYETVNLNRLLEECVLTTEQLAKAGKKARVTTRLTETEGMSIEADPVQMREAFCNVLNNAYDAVDATAGTVGVRTSVGESEVAVYIIDNGTGIAPEIMSRVFDPFFSMKARGTGLGLPVCKQILSLHGGSITLESEVGKGTTVCIKWPRERRDCQP